MNYEATLFSQSQQKKLLKQKYVHAKITRTMHICKQIKLKHQLKNSEINFIHNYGRKLACWKSKKLCQEKKKKKNGIGKIKFIKR